MGWAPARTFSLAGSFDAVGSRHTKAMNRTRFQESDPAHDFVHQYESFACTTRDGGALVS